MKLRTRSAERLAAWARQRRGRDRLPLPLHSRRLYILPTRAGAGLAALIVLMLIAGLNYGNNLALLLCFTLAGFAVVALYDTHRTLSGLVFQTAQALPAFAGQDGRIELRFDNRDGRPRRALWLRCPGAAASCFDLAAHGQATVHLPYRAGQRGLQRIDYIELSSRAPLGLFRTWTWLMPPLVATIYPRPLQLRPMPPPLAGPRADQRRQDAAGTDEWAWLRAYQPGDSPRRVAWKHYARGGPLQVAHYAGAGGGERRFDFERLSGLDTEQRLSQLCAWILECNSRGEPWGLDLRSCVLPSHYGSVHCRACLEALARFGP